MSALSQYPHAQWKLDNVDEIERLLDKFETRMQLNGDDLMIQGPAVPGIADRMTILLHPGDSVLVRTDPVTLQVSLGVLRVPDTEH